MSVASIAHLMHCVASLMYGSLQASGWCYCCSLSCFEQFPIQVSLH